MDTRWEEVGNMDWDECLKKKIAKDVKQDKNLIISARKIANVKIESANTLPERLFIGKITLLYDALRELLKCLALENGFKIYNHECYSAFLKEILKLSEEADLFNKLRRIRNGINYYGRDVNKDEAKQIINDLKVLIRQFKRWPQSTDKLRKCGHPKHAGNIQKEKR